MISEFYMLTDASKMQLLPASKYKNFLPSTYAGYAHCVLLNAHLEKSGHKVDKRQQRSELYHDRRDDNTYQKCEFQHPDEKTRVSVYVATAYINFALFLGWLYDDNLGEVRFSERFSYMLKEIPLGEKDIVGRFTKLPEFFEIYEVHKCRQPKLKKHEITCNCFSCDRVSGDSHHFIFDSKEKHFIVRNKKYFCEDKVMQKKEEKTKAGVTNLYFDGYSQFYKYCRPYLEALDDDLMIDNAIDIIKRIDYGISVEEEKQSENIMAAFYAVFIYCHYLQNCQKRPNGMRELIPKCVSAYEQYDKPVERNVFGELICEMGGNNDSAALKYKSGWQKN